MELEGKHSKRRKNKPFLWLRTFVANAFYKVLPARRPLHFALRAILQMFKLVPDHFVWILFFAVDHIYGINMEQL
jgi:hypothetical protein